MKALSACIAIGVTIIGCGNSSSGSGSDPSATCGKVAACGGNIVGSWKVGASCASPSTPSIMGCTNASVKDANVSASGTSTFNSDGTFTVETTQSASETLVIPMSCLSAGGMTATCSQLSTILGAALMGDAGTTASCTTSGSDCDCTIALPSSATHEMGTYTVSGNTLTTTSNGTMTSTDYCVQGNELHVISSGANAGGSGDVVGVKQ